jgi:6-methylsalicylate decarboxylase
LPTAVPNLPRTDVHQHLWPPALLAALARRREPPFARREDGAWQLHVRNEPPAAIRAQEPDDRARSLPAQGVDRALLSLSTALTVERLAPDQAAPLLEAWRSAALDLPASLRAWATLNLESAGAPSDDALVRENPARLLG